MHNKKELCDKIVGLYPDIGQCEIDVIVDWDDEKNVWVVDLTKDETSLNTIWKSQMQMAAWTASSAFLLGLRSHNLLITLKANNIE